MGVALAVQRLSDLDKGAAGGLQTKLIGLTTLDTDVKRAGDALGFDRAGRGALQGLPPGHFFGYGPAIPVRGVVLVRSGEVVTTHEPGRASASENAPPAPPDSLKGILDELRDVSEVPGEESSDEDGLRRRLSELEARLRKAEGASARPSRDEIEEKVRRETEHTHRRELAEEAEKTRALERRLFALQVVLDESAPLARRLATALGGVSGDARAAYEGAPKRLPGTETGEEASTGEQAGGAREDAAPTREKPGTDDLDGAKPEKRGDGKRRILGVLADLETLGASPTERPTVAPLAGYSISGTFRAILAEMGREGLLLSEGGSVRLTDAGRAEAERLHGGYRRPRSLDELHRRWTSRLPAKEAEMLQVVIERRAEDLPREELASAVNMTTSGTFRGYVSHLGRLGLVASRAGRVRATERLFPEGLR